MNARGWAELLVAEIDPMVRRTLSADPLKAIPAHFPLRVHEMSQGLSTGRGTRGTCDGLSILNQGVIYYVSTMSRRRNFTLLHELGHHLANRRDVRDWAADLPEPGRAIEEICDEVAAMLLLPGTIIDAVLSNHPVVATHLRDLYGRSSASREVCAIALAKRLECAGAVAIIDLSELRITFASRVADTRPYPWRDDAIPAGHHLRQLPIRKAVRCESWWPNPAGDPTTYYLDAVADERYGYAVFAVTDHWNVTSLHVTDPLEATPRPSYEKQLNCPSCGFDGIARHFPCSDCGQPPCPVCGECLCKRRQRDSVVCPACRLRVVQRLMVGRVCRDCASRGKSA